MELNNEKTFNLTTRALALANLRAIATHAPEAMSVERASINDAVAKTNIDILRYLDCIEDCPTCPYLDSLEDEAEEEFCECGEESAEDTFISDIVSLFDGAYVPSLGTRIVFCTN